MATYSQSFAAQVGAYLYTLTGIPTATGTAWALDESGVGNNPYGVEVNGVRAVYGTWEQGVAAAAQLIRSAPWYSGIRAAIPSGNASTVAQAILVSPWNRAGGYLATSAANLHALAAGVSSRGQGSGSGPGTGGVDLNPADLVANLNAGVAAMQKRLGIQAAPGLAPVPEPGATAANVAAAADQGLSWLVAQIASGFGAQIVAAFLAVLPLLVVLFLAYKSLQMLTET